MNENIIKEISNDLKVNTLKVEATLKLLSEGNTIPFIARYRKEVTGNLDEEQIRKISDVYEYQMNLLKRKEDIIILKNTNFYHKLMKIKIEHENVIENKKL